jgi:acetoin utilization protein AcuB
MLVKDWMTKGVMNLGPDTSVIDAAEILRKKNIRQMPVIDAGGRVVGIVSDRDVRDAMPSKYLPGDGAAAGASLAALKVNEIMTPEPLTISPEAAVESAAELLLRHKIGGLPVADEDGKLVGIITEVDVFRYLSHVTGLVRGGIQLVFLLPDVPGSAIDLLGRLKDEEVRLTSVLTSYDGVPAGMRKVSIRVQSAGRHNLQSLIALLSDSYQLLYYVTDGQAVHL